MSTANVAYLYPHHHHHFYNNRLHTSVPITRPPEVLAAAALWLARDMLCPPGSMEPVYAHQLWFEHAGVSMEDIECACGWVEGIWWAGVHEKVL